MLLVIGAVKISIALPGSVQMLFSSCEVKVSLDFLEESAKFSVFAVLRNKRAGITQSRTQEVLFFVKKLCKVRKGTAVFGVLIFRMKNEFLSESMTAFGERE